MAGERRYGEDEVSEIFALATREVSPSLPARHGGGTEPAGLTLAELQAVGAEVGLAPEAVSQAAAALDARAGRVERRTLAGAPVSAGRIVPLPRAPTDQEWQFLVAELRETFGARGKVTLEGGMKEWHNGNLHAVIEETEAGHRLRMGTTKGNATAALIMGSAWLGVALLMVLAFFVKGRLGAEFFIPAFFGIGGAAAIGSNYVRLPRWAAERERQMDHIAARARALITPPGDD